MKASIVLRRFLLASSLLAASNSAHAQTSYFWDADGAASAGTGGSGIWDTGSSLWRNGTATGPLEQWPSTDPSTAYAQLAGTAGTLTLNSDSVNLNLNRIVFGTTGYEVAGPTSGTATLNLSGTAPQINTGASIIATISAKISGSTGLTKTGAGTLTLSGTNSYTGATTVSSGTSNAGGITNVSGDQSAADGGWSINGESVVNFQEGSTVAVRAGSNIVFANGGSARTLNAYGTVTTGSTSNLTLRGRSTLNLESGADWTQGGTLTIQPLNSGFGATMNVKSGASFTYNGTANITLAKSTSGNSGSATLTLSGGTFTTSRGLSNTNAGTGDGTTRLNFSNGGSLKLSADIASLILQGSSTFAVETTGIGGGVIDTNGFSTAIPVGISGTGGLIKKGEGTLTLSGTSAYEGATLVSVGTLLVTGALANGAVTVDPLASLGGTGSIGGNLTAAANSFFNVVNINDPLVVGGTITFGSGFGIANLTGIDWDSLNLNNPYTVISTAQTFGTGNIADFGLANAVDVGNTGRQAYFADGSLAVVIIPEPSAALLGGLGLLALLRRRRTS